jgi:hypothetical protein
LREDSLSEYLCIEILIEPFFQGNKYKTILSDTNFIQGFIMATKSTILILLNIILLSIQSAFAQIPNYSFENWTSNNPDGWTTNNIVGYLTPVTQSNIAHSGSSSARIEMMNSILGSLQPVLNAGPLITGIPVSQRHSTINFYYEYFPNSATEYILMSVGMMKGGQIIGVAVGSTKTGQSTYTKLTASINYYNSQIPDAATIYITLIDSFFNSSTIGSYALIDDIYFDQLTEVAEDNSLSQGFTLEQNYPNPFNSTTDISYKLPFSCLVTLKIYNSLGIEIKTLVNEYQKAGIYYTSFNADLELPSGVYFYQLKGGNNTQTKKMILLK